MSSHKESSGDPYTGRLLRPNYAFSFPVSRPDEEMYQVLQLILLPNTPLSKPEIYAALADEDPQRLFSLLGISFVTNSKTTHRNGIERIKRAYDGTIRTVPWAAEHLIFPVTTLENEHHTLQFVASAYARSVQCDSFGKPVSVELANHLPYFLFYLITPRTPARAGLSLSSFIQKQFEVATVVPIEDTTPGMLAYTLSTQLFTAISSYVSSHG